MLQTRIKNRPIRCGIVILALLAVLLGIPVAAAQTVGEAFAAYKRGDYATAIRGFRVHAEQGDARAQVLLGFMYDDGEGVPENDAEAVKWFRKAAEQGDASGQLNLGSMYADGKGVLENDAEAVKWVRKAAEQGDVSGQVRLGIWYNYGMGVPKDYVLAYAWYNLAAAQGSKIAAKAKDDDLRPLMTAAQIAQAQKLSDTLFTPLAAEQTLAEALAAFKRGDYVTAMEGFRVHAEQGDALVQYMLGGMYAEGKGVPENDVEAVKWVRKAAEQGYANAQYSLGGMYIEGKGVPENAAEAVKWYRKAAEQGNDNAQLRLGGMYFVGEGVPEDYVLAYAWHNLAAAQGNKAAAEIKDSLRPRMTAAQIAQAQELSATLVLTR